jgi:hypothetical protein
MRSEVTSRSNWANDSNTLRVRRPIEVVILNCWVRRTRHHGHRTVPPAWQNQPVYVGEVQYKNEIFPGPQAPLMERELFEAVQTKLTEQRSHRTVTRTKSASLLSGFLFDDAGTPWLPRMLPRIGCGIGITCPHLDFAGLSAPFRQGLTARGLAWAVGIPRHLKVYPVDVRLIWLVAKRGRPRQRSIPDILSIAAA